MTVIAHCASGGFYRIGDGRISALNVRDVGTVNDRSSIVCVGAQSTALAVEDAMPSRTDGAAYRKDAQGVCWLTQSQPSRGLLTGRQEQARGHIQHAMVTI